MQGGHGNLRQAVLLRERSGHMGAAGTHRRRHENACWRKHASQFPALGSFTCVWVANKRHVRQAPPRRPRPASGAAARVSPAKQQRVASQVCGKGQRASGSGLPGRPQGSTVQVRRVRAAWVTAPGSDPAAKWVVVGCAAAGGRGRSRPGGRGGRGGQLGGRGSCRAQGWLTGWVGCSTPSAGCKAHCCVQQQRGRPAEPLRTGTG